NYSVTLSTPLTDNAQGFVTAADAAGNTIGPKTVVGGKDTIAPDELSYDFNDTGLIADDGVTNDGVIKIANLESGATWEYSLDGGKNWQKGSGQEIELIEGTYSENSIQFRQTDLAGNMSETTIIDTQVIVDKTITKLNLELHSDTGISKTDSITSSGQINVSGIEDGAIWTYSIDGGETWIESDLKDSFIVPEGKYAAGTIQVQHYDIAGNNAITTFGAVTVDTDSNTPALRFSDTGVSNTDNITKSTLISVSNLEIGATWEYSLDGGKNWNVGGVVANITTDSFNVMKNTTYQAGQIQVRQTDSAGNVSKIATFDHSMIIDNSSPLGNIYLNGQTSSTSPDIIKSSGTIVLNVNGGYSSWRYSLDNGKTFIKGSNQVFDLVLPEGYYPKGTIIVEPTDLAGNIGWIRNLENWTVDQTPPQKLEIEFNDTGVFTDDGITNDGVIKVKGIEANATWQYSLDGGNSWIKGVGDQILLADGTYLTDTIQFRQIDVAENISQTTSIDYNVVVDTVLQKPTLALEQDNGALASDGISNNGTVNVSGLETGSTWKYSLDGGSTWTAGTGTSFDVPVGSYASGKIQVQQTDLAGNSNIQSLGVITIDKSIATPTLKLAVDSGASATDGITNNGVVNVTGLEAGATWKYSLDGGSTWTTGTGSSFDVPAGSYAAGKIQVQQTDTAGNSATQNLTAITVDKTASAISLSLASDTGSSAIDGITNNGTVNVTGLEAGATWKYSLDGGLTWASGTESSFVIPAGSYVADKIQVQQTDLAGNSSTIQKMGALTVDTSITIPTLTLLADDGSSNSDGKTSNGTITVSNLETGVTWKYSVDGGSTWITGSGNTFEVPVGRYALGKIVVQQTDVAGNVSQSGIFSKDLLVSKVEAVNDALTADPWNTTYSLVKGSNDISGTISSGTFVLTKGQAASLKYDANVPANTTAFLYGTTKYKLKVIIEVLKSGVYSEVTSATYYSTTTNQELKIANNYDTSNTYRVRIETTNEGGSGTGVTKPEFSAGNTSLITMAANGLVSDGASWGKAGNLFTNDILPYENNYKLEVKDGTGTFIEITSTSGQGQRIYFDKVMEVDFKKDGTYILDPINNIQSLGKTGAFEYRITDLGTGKSDTATVSYDISSKGIIMNTGLAADSGVATLTGTTGNDVIVSRGANETITSGAGQDVLIYNLLKDANAGGNGSDVWTDFQLGSATSGGDIIDIRGLLSNQNVTATNINSYLKVTTLNGSTIISVDIDGTTAAKSSNPLLVLQNTNTTLDELLKNGQILF
ncbi:type I secretion C-terminal target domain-containing protein, partial [Acinetobacter sp. 187]|nr:type I secretion C-terminal target domain-containing protein [Acinetobacter lanii]